MNYRIAVYFCSINHKKDLKLCLITSHELIGSFRYTVLLKNVHEYMPDKSRKFSVIVYVCSQVIMKQIFVPYFKTMAKIIKVFA